MRQPSLRKISSSLFPLTTALWHVTFLFNLKVWAPLNWECNFTSGLCRRQARYISSAGDPQHAVVLSRCPLSVVLPTAFYASLSIHKQILGHKASTPPVFSLPLTSKAHRKSPRKPIPTQSPDCLVYPGLSLGFFTSLIGKPYTRNNKCTEWLSPAGPSPPASLSEDLALFGLETWWEHLWTGNRTLLLPAGDRRTQTAGTWAAPWLGDSDSCQKRKCFNLVYFPWRWN